MNFEKFKNIKPIIWGGAALLLAVVVFVGINQKNFYNKELNAAQVISSNKYSGVTELISPNDGVVSGTLFLEEEEVFKDNVAQIVNKEFYLVTENYEKIYIDKNIKNIESNLGNYIVYDFSKKEIVETKNNGSVKLGGSGGYRNGSALVFLVRFENSLQNPGSVSQIRSRLFPTASQGFTTLSSSLSSAYVDRFFRQTSQNKVKYNGNVYGWYEVPGLGSSYITPYSGVSCYVNDTIIQDMVEYYNVNTSRYNTIITIANCADYNNIGGIYTGYYSVLGDGHPFWTTRIVAGHNNFYPDASGYTTVPGYASVAIHELGHSFGLDHSNALDCNTETIGQNCGHIEYGNPFDRMGLPYRVGIFSFIQQKKVGWIDEDNILQITSPGSYYINDIQKQDGVIGAEISVPGLELEYPVFYLEHRKPLRFNSWLAEPIYNSVINGLLLYANTGHVSSSGAGGLSWWQPWANNTVRIVDPNPTGESIIYDIGYDSIYDTFYDPNFGITIDVTSVDTEGIHFDVDYSTMDYCPPDESMENVLSNYRVESTSFMTQDIMDPVMVPTYVGTTTVDNASFIIDGNGYVDEYPICPAKNYTVIPSDAFTDDIINGPQNFSVIPQALSTPSVDISEITAQSPGTYNLNFTIRDQFTLEEQPVNINIIRTQ